MNCRNSISINLNPVGEGDQLEQWLSPLHPEHTHESVRAKRVKDVGGWLLQRNKFREWSDRQGVPRQAVLFCYGHPGVGKTYIRSVGRSRTCRCR